MLAYMLGRATGHLRRALGVACIAGALVGCSLSTTDPGDDSAAPLPQPVAAVPELASRVPDWLAADGRLDIGTDPSYPPMEFVTDDGLLDGADIQLAQAVAAVLDLTPDFGLDAFTALESGVRSRRHELGISAITIEPGRLTWADAVIYLRAGSQLIRPRGSVISLDDLCGSTVGALEGSIQISLLLDADSDCSNSGSAALRILGYADQNDGVELVTAGEIDAMLVDSTSTNWIVDNRPGRLEAAPQVVSRRPLGILVDPTEDGWPELVADAVTHLIEEGTYAEILQRFDITEGWVDAAEVRSPQDAIDAGT